MKKTQSVLGALLLNCCLIWQVSAANVAVLRPAAPDRTDFLASFGGINGQKSSMPETDATMVKPGFALQSPVNFEAEIVDNEVRIARARSLREEDLRLSREAIRQIEIGEAELVKGDLINFIQAQPLAHESRQVLVMLLMKQRKTAEATGYLAEGLRLAPDLTVFKKLYARMHLAADPVGALEMIAAYPPDLADDTEYFELYGLLLQANKQFDAANAVYRSLVRIDERQAAWWFGVAISYDSLGQRAEAEAAFEMAQQLGLDDMTLDRYNRSRLAALRGRS